MGQLLYVTPASLDGFIGRDNYDWSEPGEDFLALINDLMRPIGIYLYGRKTYQTMAVWQTPEVLGNLKPESLEFARVWQAAEKIVYSKSLKTVSTPKTRLEGNFDPSSIRDLKARSPAPLSIGGPELAAQAIRGGVVDEIHLFVVPIILGGGVPILPKDVVVRLDLLEERRLQNGWLYLSYRPRT